jgi:hypothetical protein
MNSQAFADLIATVAILASDGCSQPLRDTYSPPSITHVLATITTCLRLPWDITHGHSSLFRLCRALSEPTVATQPIYNLQ